MKLILTIQVLMALLLHGILVTEQQVQKKIQRIFTLRQVSTLLPSPQMAEHVERMKLRS